jgi:multidrug transporter EmrE-like cation transporter
MTKYHLYLLIAIFLTVVVQALLKMLSVEYEGNINKGLIDIRFYLSLCLYVLAFSLWFVSASSLEFSILIPANMLTVVLAACIGYFFFNEGMTIQKISSYLIILLGLVLLLTDQSKGI